MSRLNSRLQLGLDRQLEQAIYFLNNCASYSDDWHYHAARVARLTRKWRETHTLKSVK